MSRSDQEYIDFDPFVGEDGTLTLRNVRIRTAKKEHNCLSLSATTSHVITPGQRYRHERALVDSDFFGEWKMCLECVEKELRILEGECE